MGVPFTKFIWSSPDLGDTSQDQADKIGIDLFKP